MANFIPKKTSENSDGELLTINFAGAQIVQPKKTFSKKAQANPFRRNRVFKARARRVLLSATQMPVYSGYCAACKTTVELITFEQAVEIACDKLDNLLESSVGGSLHIAILPEALLICLESLAQNIAAKQQAETEYRKIYST